MASDNRIRYIPGLWAHYMGDAGISGSAAACVIARARAALAQHDESSIFLTT